MPNDTPNRRRRVADDWQPLPAYSHHQHSSMVRVWAPTQTAAPFGIDWTEGTSHSLRSPHEGYLIQVTFTPYVDHPEHVRVRSTNWRTEHEPNTIVSVEEARAFYSRLLKAGFVKVPAKTEEAK